MLILLFCRCTHRAGRTDADSVHHRKDGGSCSLRGDLHLHGGALPHRGPQRRHGDQFLYRQVWGDGRALRGLRGTYGRERTGASTLRDVVDIFKKNNPYIIVFF